MSADTCYLVLYGQTLIKVEDKTRVDFVFLCHNNNDKNENPHQKFGTSRLLRLVFGIQSYNKSTVGKRSSGIIIWNYLPERSSGKIFKKNLQEFSSGKIFRKIFRRKNLQE